MPRPQTIYPQPRESVLLEGDFLLTEAACIVLSEEASPADLSLARLLTRELTDRYGVAIQTRRGDTLLPGAPLILMGTLASPLIRQACAQCNIPEAEQDLESEGYLLRVEPGLILIAGGDESGAFYGLQSLRQLIRKEGAHLSVPGVQIRDWPHLPFRGMRMYLPGRENLTFFRRFLADCMALYKFNKLILEPNAGMRLDRHPELNAGWFEFGRNLRDTRRERPAGPHGEIQDSAHHDTADGGVLEKDEVAVLVRWARENYIEIIPEIACLTHSYYLLTRHRELAEIADAEWPDTYCPSNPASYDLLFDVFDEYIEVMQPAMVNIGHDEWRIPWGICPHCRDKDPRELFAQDVNRIHAYLTGKGLRMAFWGDHLIERLRGEQFGTPWYEPPGFSYRTPGALSDEQVRQRIPKDILIFNWFWNDAEKGQGEVNDRQISAWGFEQVYGNFLSAPPNFAERSKIPGVLGGVPSFWAATTEFNLGTDYLSEALPCASLLWSGQELEQPTQAIQALMPDIRRRLSGLTFPGDMGKTVVPVEIAPCFTPIPPTLDLAAPHLSESPYAVIVGVAGETEAAFPLQSPEIEIGMDVDSLLFLHACARPAPRLPSFAYLYNFEDTATLLGWYEVTYRDGFVVTVPLRYGVQLLAWDWQQHPDLCCYEAVPVPGDSPPESPMSFFRYEWINPRPGKEVSHIRLKGARRFTCGQELAPSNALFLRAVSVVKAGPDSPEGPQRDRAGERDPMKL